MTPGDTDSRWEVLAVLRFFLAWVVACGHLAWFLPDPNPFVRFFDMFGGKAAVTGFLLVSGYSIAASIERRTEGFYRRRLLRIYPLYFSAVVAAWVLQARLHEVKVPGYLFHQSGPVTCAGNFVFLQTFLVRPIAFNGVVWSLSLEVFYYLLAPFLVRVRPRYLLMMIGVSGLVYLIPRPNDWGLAFVALSKFHALRYLWAWLLGFLCYQPGHPLRVAALGLFGGTVVGLNRSDNYEPLVLVTFFLSFALIIGSSRVRLPRGLQKPFGYLGDLSYPLYLFQLPCFIAGYELLFLRDPVTLTALTLLMTISSYHGIDVYAKKRFLIPWSERLPAVLAQLGVWPASAEPGSPGARAGLGARRAGLVRKANSVAPEAGPSAV